MRRWTPTEVMATLDTELRGAGASAVVLSAPRARPTIEVLATKRALQVVEELPWRWAHGGRGVWRMIPTVVYTFDGGVAVVCHEPSSRLRSSRARLLHLLARRAPAGEGLVDLPPAEQALYAAAESGRRPGPQVGRTTALEELLADTSEAEVLALARTAGVTDQVTRGLRRVGQAPASHGVTSPAGEMRRQSASPTRRTGRIAARVRRLVPGAVLALRRGDLVGAQARCRFDGLELAAGPGVFLPRGVSEPLAEIVEQRLRAGGSVIEVGTGCGAVALAIAARRPDAKVTATEVDRRAARWARRNVRRRHPGGGGPEIMVGSLLEPVPASRAGAIGMIVGNVPCLPPEAFEGAADAPSAAYVGESADGLGLQRALARQSAPLLEPGGSLVLQLSPRQWSILAPELVQLGLWPEEGVGDDVAVLGLARRPALAERRRGDPIATP